MLFQSARHTPTRRRSSGCRPAGRVYECFCTRAEIRAAASAPHGPLPEGAYPGTCLRLTDGERRRKRAGGRPPALRLRADAARIGFEDRLLGPLRGGRRRLRRAPQRRRGRLQPRGHGRRRGAGHRRGRARRRPARLDPAPAARRAPARPARARRGRTCRSCSGRTARGWPSATASVTLREVDPAAAVRWMAATLGFEGAASAAEMLDALRPGRAAARAHGLPGI